MMMKHSALLLLLVALLPSFQAISPPHRISDILGRGIQQSAWSRGVGGDVDVDVELNDISSSDDVEILYFNQRLDHFSNDAMITTTTSSYFKQRFFYSPRYATFSGGGGGGDGGGPRGNRGKKHAAAPLAFLCVGGEGPDMDSSVLIDSVHCTGDMIGLAEKLHVEHGREVHLFALEHRYYGNSFPNDTMVDYSYLSSRQAVRDIISFVQSMEVQQLLNRVERGSGDKYAFWDQSASTSKMTATKRRTSAETTPIFITFGGSYPGMLAAWSRLLHPETIFAAVSNSAPIRAQLEFPEYKERVGFDLGSEDIGGSAECRFIVEEGHAQVAAILERYSNDTKSDDLDRVATMFNVCGGSDMLRASRRNQESFVGDGLIDIPAQSNDPHCTADLCSIEKLCSTIVNERQLHPTKPSMEILARISMLQGNNITCQNVDWNAYLDYFSTPSTENANDVSWMYQTCTEFGFYTTCNVGSQCPYAKGYHDVSRDLEFCHVVFGIDPETVKQNVNSTLTYYGGWNLSPNTGESPRSGDDDGNKHIIFVNGDADPWTALALTDGNEDHPSFLVHDASHHFWTHPVKDNDGVFVVNARRTIYGILSDWLGVAMLGTIDDWREVSSRV